MARIDGDPAALATMLLTQADWVSAPQASPETLGLRLVGLPLDGEIPGRDVALAQQLYQRADDAYHAAGCPRGRAAVALRRAYLADDGADRAQLLGQVVRWTREAGDGAAFHLARVHELLAAVEQGQDPGMEVVDELAAWAGSVGSTSYARGLCRLLTAWAARARGAGDVIQARGALRTAERLVVQVGTTLEAPIVRAGVAQLYGGTNYRRAAYVLENLELDANIAVVRTAGTDPDTVAWLRLADKAMGAFNHANALGDADLLEAACRQFGWVQDMPVRALADPSASAHPPVPASRNRLTDAEGGAVRIARRILTETAARASVLVPLYRGVDLQTAGRDDEVRAVLAGALAAADRAVPDAWLERVLVLRALGRVDEARALADAYAATLLPDTAVSLFLRLNAAREAQAVLGRLDEAGPPAPGERPWEDPARRAEVREAVGDHDAAAQAATRAIELFELHLVRIARDVLRTSVADDATVAAMYQTAALAMLGQAARRVPGDPDPALVAAAFLVADRCRGLGFVAMDDLRATPLGPAATARLRAWLRAGSRWAATFEELAGIRPGPGAPSLAGIRARVIGAEAELDEAELALSRVAPHVLAARRSQPVRTLSGQVQRYNAACAFPGHPDPKLGADLAELLIEPFDDVIGRHERVLVVPGGPLAPLPFHVLPWRVDPLGHRRVVSYLPAARLLGRREATAGRRTPESCMVVGDPAYPPEQGLARLPGTARPRRWRWRRRSVPTRSWGTRRPEPRSLRDRPVRG